MAKVQGFYQRTLDCWYGIKYKAGQLHWKYTYLYFHHSADLKVEVKGIQGGGPNEIE